MAQTGGPRASDTLARLLRQHRRERGLTQEQLAEKAGVSARNIQNLECGLNAPRRDTLERLVVSLGLQGKDRTLFKEAALPRPRRREQRGRRPGQAGVRTNLPRHLTSFIGRVQETAAIRSELSRTRLLTLTGPGGIGKTRLALQVAEEKLHAFHDGVWFVDLTSVSDPGLVPLTVSVQINLRVESETNAEATLLGALANRQLLLVIDNCEHLIIACRQLAEALLRTCPNVYVLATSREPLNVEGEIVWRVPSLSVPSRALAPLSLEDLAETDAVRLLIERARAVCPSFVISEEVAPAIAELCWGLDGIPLALELAAPWMSIVSIRQFADRLTDSLRLLTTGSHSMPRRHQTLRATIDWSYRLLSDAEREFFDRLSVFAGGWTLEAVEEVATGGSVDRSASLDVLRSLVEKSLVLVEPQSGGSMRYRLLETLRQYGRARLEAKGTADTIRLRHASYFVAFAEQAQVHMYAGPEHGAWLDRLWDDQDNLRAALRWCIDNAQVELGLRLAGAVWRFWILRGSLTEGRDWLAWLLGLIGNERRTVLHARALNGAGVLAAQQGDYSAALALLEQSLAISCELGNQGQIAASMHNIARLRSIADPEQTQRACSMLDEAVAIAHAAGERIREAMSLNVLGGLLAERGDYAAAYVKTGEALLVYQQLQDPTGMALALTSQAHASLAQGELRRAHSMCMQGLHLARGTRDAPAIAWCLLLLGLICLHDEKYSEAKMHLQESLRVWQRGDRARFGGCLEGIASVASAEGDAQCALCLFGSAARLRHGIAFRSSAWSPDTPFDRATFRRWEACARSALSAGLADRAWAAGYAMSLEQSIEYALSGGNQCAGVRR
jgi:predicted ATPase/DNA-binding XRE family transcriptional regulator